MNNHYVKTFEEKGFGELAALVKRWETVSENISKRPTNAPIVLPDLFVYTHSGYGNTEILFLLAEYLESKKNLMSFCGDVKFFEFKLEYCRPEANFSELYRLMECTEAAAGFSNQYKGIIRINVNSWVGHQNEKHFIDFLKYLQVNTAHWFVILTLSKEEENEKTRGMEAVVSMFLRIEKITLRAPDDKELVEYAADRFSEFGLTLDEGAKQLLQKSIGVLRGNKYFYGFHTVTEMCNDIVYALYSRTSPVDKVITSEMLGDFAPESEYVKRTVIKIKQTISLGFLTQG